MSAIEKSSGAAAGGQFSEPRPARSRASVAATPSHEIRYFRLPKGIQRKPIEEFALRLRTHVIPGYCFACLITTDRALQRLNLQFRGKDYATDVLSFPVVSFPAPADGNLGDLAISWQRAREQAREFGHSVETEINILMLHGVLHLWGMDHEIDHGEMSRTEKHWRRTLNLPAGLIERVGA